MTDGRLSLEAFRDRLAEELEVDLADAGAGSRLGDDLELDSVQRLEALVAVEDLGVHLPDDSVGPEQTLGGLHELYLRGGRPGPEPLPPQLGPVP
ncbi:MULTISPECIES: acyl carrier protein [unclassified Modestobacter]|uniref:acyl carrier protein n=1 Tax=unclassified Modestobacter TaxID=2643866 RepID=UPI0022AB38CB|nr:MULTISPECIES: acyl carrier protein [unclassified Modestobacter]MCZ2825742.1 acyl carrier protein [Modestobacter sp. VKM Ac-2981]MCZ2853193.1 acyl carrier protein [Modestobacter sp. VKM Ac-2982]